MTALHYIRHVTSLHNLPHLAAHTYSSSDPGFTDGSENLGWLSQAINIALHLFLVGSFVAFAAGLVMLVRERKDQMVGRAMALFIGSLVVVGAQASGKSYADFIIGALGSSRSPAFGFFGAVVPGAMGLALGYYFTRGARRSNERAIRGMIMIGTFSITQFALMYAIAIDRTGSELGKAITPNVAFVAGLGLWLVMNLGIKPDTPDPAAKRGAIAGLTNRFSKRDESSISAPLGSTSRFHNDK